MHMSRYAYDYSLSPARPTGWRGTLASITVVGTVIAVSTISGVLVTLQLFASTPPAAAVMPQVATTSSVLSAPQPANRVVAAANRVASAFAAARNQVEAPATVAAAPAAPATPPVVPAPPKVAPPVTVTPNPAPAAAIAPPSVRAPVAESELTFAKGYEQRRAIANGAVVRRGKVLIAAQAQLGRAALKAKPKVKVYARNNAAGIDRRRADAAHNDAYGMFQRFERPDQFDFNRHQALAYGEQRMIRRRNDAPPQRQYAPNGFFGGLF